MEYFELVVKRKLVISLNSSFLKAKQPQKTTEINQKYEPK